MLWYGLGRPVLTPQEVIVPFSYCLDGVHIRGNHEVGTARAEPFIPDAIKTLENNRAASLLLLSFAKLSSTKDLTNRQTCQRILCVST